MEGLQLSMRYSHLASTFSSLDMTDEACLALVLAILYDMVDSVVAGEDSNEEEPLGLLRHFSCLTNGVVYMGASASLRESRRSLVGRLVLLVQRRRSPSSGTCPLASARRNGEAPLLYIKRLLRCSVGDANETNVEETIASTIEKETQMPFSVSALLAFVFKKRHFMSMKFESQMDALQTEQLKTVAYALTEQGAPLQHLSKDREAATLNARLDEFKKQTQFLVALSKRKFQNSNEPMCQMMLAVVRVIAASSLVPAYATNWVANSKTDKGRQAHLRVSCPYKEDIVLSQACSLASQAKDTLTLSFETAIGEGEQRLALTVLLACVTLYCSEMCGEKPSILSAKAKHVLLSNCREAVQSESVGCEMRDPFRTCLTRTLSRFQDMINLEGDKILASQAALLILRLNNENTDKGVNSWYRAIAGNLLQDGGLPYIAKEVLGSNRTQKSNWLQTADKTLELKDVLSLEMAATRLRLEGYTSDADGGYSVVEKAQQLFSYCSEALGSSGMERDAELSTSLDLQYLRYDAC